MNLLLRNTLAVAGGWHVESVVNSSIVMINGSVIPLPELDDVSTIEGLPESMSIS